MSKPEKILKKYRKQPSTQEKREWLTLYYEEKVSIRSIADDYGFPAYTVRRILHKMDPDRKTRSDAGKEQAGPVIELPDFDKLSLEGESLETQLEMFIQSIMQSVQTTKKLSAKHAAYIMSASVLNLKRLRSVQFANMVKNIDARIVATIIRMFEPQASDTRIIEVFKEAHARVKLEKNKK